MLLLARTSVYCSLVLFVSTYLLTFIMRRRPYYVVGALEIFSMMMMIYLNPNPTLFSTLAVWTASRVCRHFVLTTDSCLPLLSLLTSGHWSHIVKCSNNTVARLTSRWAKYVWVTGHLGDRPFGRQAVWAKG